MDPQDNAGVSNIASVIIRLKREGNCFCLDLSKLMQQLNAKQVCLSYDVCTVEKAARRALKINTSIMSSIKKQGMAYCDQCKLSTHNTVSNTAISKVEGCENLACF